MFGFVAQREIRRRRFDFKHIERGPGDLAAPERVEQRGFVHQPAAGAIDDPHPAFAQRQAAGVEHVPGFGRHRHVHGNEIRARQEVVQILEKLHLQRARPAGREVGIVRGDAHPERDGAAGEFAADAAHAEDAEGFAVQFHALEFLAVPFAGGDAGVRLRDGPGGRNQEGKRVFGGRDGVAVGRVHHDDAPARRGLDVHVVHAHAGAADHAQVGGGFEHFGGDFGLAAHDERGVAGDFCDQFAFGERLARVDVHFEQTALADFLDAARRNGIGNQDFELVHDRWGGEFTGWRRGLSKGKAEGGRRRGGMCEYIRSYHEFTNAICVAVAARTLSQFLRVPTSDFRL